MHFTFCSNGKRVFCNVKIASVVISLLLSFVLLAGCKATSPVQAYNNAQGGVAGDSQSEVSIAKGENYYDLESVVLYLESYNELPPNYVTKKEARKQGWYGGNPSNVIPGAAIGGDYFGNYEGALPKLPKGESYRECDIDTDESKSRGERRLIYVDDGDSSNGAGPYYYTEDHYDSFAEVQIQNGKVIIND
nr:ribonuclease domain-containing protein [Olegusella massiliensis]